jgi:hypothetical protein
MYIVDIDRSAHAFECPLCGKLWKQYGMLARHEKTCPGRVQKDKFRDGVYTNSENILHWIKMQGIAVDTNWVYHYRACVDFFK